MKITYWSLVSIIESYTYNNNEKFYWILLTYDRMVEFLQKITFFVKNKAIINLKLDNRSYVYLFIYFYFFLFIYLFIFFFEKKKKKKKKKKSLVDRHT